MFKHRRICVVTGTRADYGLLYWTMREIENDPDLELVTIVTGMHLSPTYGNTYKIIEKDGFHIDARVEMLLSSDSPVAVVKSLGIAVVGFADCLERLRPDVIVLLGDRYEILACAQAALILQIPVAHIHGGELTEGAFDDAIRHSITKMSQLHFVANEDYRRRVIQLGEQPDSVYTVGAPGLDNVERLTLLSRNELEAQLGFSLGPLSFLVTYHPVTLDANGPGGAFISLLQALDQFPDAHIVFTHPNSDPSASIIRSLLEQYTDNRPGKTIAFTSMGQLRYLSAMKHVDVVVGNSSSGIIEAPYLKTATVNIGSRQTGRLKSPSVIDCSESAEDIVRAIKQAIDKNFRHMVKDSESLFGTGNASKRIVEVLKRVTLQGILQKKFYDIPMSLAAEQGGGVER